MIGYAVPVWKKALTKQYNKEKLLRVHRLMAIRIIKGYRTISHSAASLLAGVTPIDIKLEEMSEQYNVEKGYGEFEGISKENLDLPVPCRLWNHPSDVKTFLSFEEDSFPVTIYTDGSKTDHNTGAAFVVIQEGEILHSEQFRLGVNCSNNQAEALAIEEALKWTECNVDRGVRVLIKSDSMVSIMAVNNHNNHYPLTESIRSRLQSLSRHRDVNVSLSWVKGHAGIAGNEEADRLARDASMNETLEVKYQSIPRSFLKRKINEKSLQKWEQRWQESQTGSMSKKFFPNVRKRLSIQLKESFKQTQILSGHGHFGAYLKRFHVITNATCPCDSETEQTVDHILFSCPLLEPLRAPLIRKAVIYLGAWPVSHQELISEDLYEEFHKFIGTIDFNNIS